MKGILKIYHPEETLKYHIVKTYCKALYLNKKHSLELEIETNESLDHVEDDSLQYNFPQLSFSISSFPLADDQLVGKKIILSESDCEEHTHVDLFNDDDVFLHNNELEFSQDETKNLIVVWKGIIDDFYTQSGTPIFFKLKCNFKPDEFDIDD